jgi:aspartate-semialdehyde dehydrogenase
MTSWKVGVIGVTGAVGRTMLACLAESRFPIGELRGYATPRSVGIRLPLPGAAGEEIVVEPLAEERLQGLDLVLLSAGAEVSRTWRDRVLAGGCWAIDNSSAFRLDPSTPLVVPEVNATAMPQRRGWVANPNCSTIQMVVAVAPLARRFGLRRIHVATYQSVSGRGQKGIDALRAERAGGQAPDGAFPAPIDGNVVAQCDALLPDGFTREEEKMILETRKILAMPDLPVHPTCARVPVEVGHSEAVHLELDRPASREELLECLVGSPGIRVERDPAGLPTPRAVEGRNEVWIGRVRRDRSDPRVVELWVVADNLRKGAAWNAVQIASLAHARETGDAHLPAAARI